MAITKLTYQSPHLTVLGTERDVLLSDANSQIRQAVRALAVECNKAHAG